MKRIVILLVVLTLSACGTAPLKEEEEYPEGGIPPDQWKVLGGATGWFAKT